MWLHYPRNFSKLDKSKRSSCCKVTWKSGWCDFRCFMNGSRLGKRKRATHPVSREIGTNLSALSLRMKALLYLANLNYLPSILKGYWPSSLRIPSHSSFPVSNGSCSCYDPEPHVSFIHYSTAWKVSFIVQSISPSCDLRAGRNQSRMAVGVSERVKFARVWVRGQGERSSSFLVRKHDCTRISTWKIK